MKKFITILGTTISYNEEDSGTINNFVNQLCDLAEIIKTTKLTEQKDQDALQEILVVAHNTLKFFLDEGTKDYALYANKYKHIYIKLMGSIITIAGYNQAFKIDETLKADLHKSVLMITKNPEHGPKNVSSEEPNIAKLTLMELCKEHKRYTVNLIYIYAYLNEQLPSWLNNPELMPKSLDSYHITPRQKAIHECLKNCLITKDQTILTEQEKQIKDFFKSLFNQETSALSSKKITFSSCKMESKVAWYSVDIVMSVAISDAGNETILQLYFEDDGSSHYDDTGTFIPDHRRDTIILRQPGGRNNILYHMLDHELKSYNLTQRSFSTPGFLKYLQSNKEKLLEQISKILNKSHKKKHKQKLADSDGWVTVGSSSSSSSYKQPIQFSERKDRSKVVELPKPKDSVSSPAFKDKKRRRK